ncbi:alpha/beta hydrolase family protein [Pseudoalteromonas xiamenensis]
MNKWIVLLLLCCASLKHSTAQAQQLDKPDWGALVDSASTQTTFLSPNGAMALVLQQKTATSLEYLSKDSVALAGLNFYLNLPSRKDTNLYHRATLAYLDNEKAIEIRPEGVIVDVNWSPDSMKIGLLIQKNGVINPWLYNLQTEHLSKVSSIELSVRLGHRHIRWAPDSTSFIVKQRTSKVEVTSTPETRQPLVLSSAEQKHQGRTYPDLLQSESLVEQFTGLAQSSLARVDLSGEVTNLTRELLVYDFALSPDGRYLLIESLPSVLPQNLTFKKWGRSYQIVDIAKRSAIYTLKELGNKPNNTLPKDWAPEGARLAKWLPHEPASVSWVEATDNGLMRTQQPFHDKVLTLAAPFDSQPKLLIEVEWRTHDILWSDSGVGVLQQWRFEDKQASTSLISQSLELQLLNQRDYRDKYHAFGDPLWQRTPEGNQRLILNNSNLFMTSSGQSKVGYRPKLTAINTVDLSSKVIFESTENNLEQVVTATEERYIIQSENAMTPPFLIRSDLNNPAVRKPFYFSSNAATGGHESHQIQYQRADGLELSGILHLPKTTSIAEKQKFPAVLWIYPKEFENKKLSQQHNVPTNMYRAFDASSPLVFLKQGIAVFESPSMPITAFDGSQPNDQFIEQLTENAKAAVNALAKSGQIDINRLALMGHSYGAFAVANLLVHTDLFKVGIARSGAYNRTLTPFGFQGEKRKLWEAKATYLDMSPYLSADKLNEPLLLIHGELDQNAGTTPLQSELMYRALIANNKTAKLIMLPFEGHSYQGYENLVFMLNSQSDWLESHL